MLPNDASPLREGLSQDYPAFQLARAIIALGDVSSEAHGAAEKRISRWMSVWSGMLSGFLNIGSRKPISGMPVWVTPEVVTGGFATGTLMAGGDFLPGELELFARIAPGVEEPDRSVLNRYYLTEEGLAELGSLVESGCYRISVPEEGALLTLTWLLNQGRAEESRELLADITPYFGQLRFYPQRAAEPEAFDRRVFLDSVGQVKARLQRIEPRPRIAMQRQTIETWTPFHRRMISLFLETVEGEAPSIRLDEDGCWADPVSGKFRIAGGWPCQTYPAGWRESAVALLSELAAARQRHGMSRRLENPRNSFFRLSEFLDVCVRNPANLSGRDVGSIRLILARDLTRNGAPGSEKANLKQSLQLRQTAAPQHFSLARVVERRLDGHPAGKGMEEPAEVLGPVTPDEESRTGVPAGSHVPDAIVRKVRRSRIDTPGNLIECGLIPSAEILARLIPAFTAALRARAFDDPQGARLYGSIDVAFRARRSLLLLNLESQVKLGELPWIRQLEKVRPADFTTAALVSQTLKELVILTLRSFPHAIIPNQLLKDFRALARAAGIFLPLTDELAADIFMGDLLPVFSSAARMAALGRVTPGSVYSRYYAIDYAEIIRRVPEPSRDGQANGKSDQPLPRSPLIVICEERADRRGKLPYSVAGNGVLMEQVQILTTHNLAGLFEFFGLDVDPSLDLPDLARSCFRWICKRQQVPSPHPHARLIMLKNTAYAWRQMIFFLAAIPSSQVDEFLDWATSHLAEQSLGFRQRFEPVLDGLRQAHLAGPEGKVPESIQRFTGWSVGNHPLW